MPAPTDIIQGLTTPPFAALQQVLDTGGPYTGDNSLTTFHTSGAFLLPAGTYSVAGTYGMLVAFHTIPTAAGFRKGFNGILLGNDVTADEYFDRVAQVCLANTLPVSGATVIKATFDVNRNLQMLLWPGLIEGPGAIGLHVFPNFAVDLYYLCVL